MSRDIGLIYASEATAMTREAILKRKCAEYDASPKKIAKVLKKIQTAARREQYSILWGYNTLFNCLTDADITTLNDLGYTVEETTRKDFWETTDLYVWKISWPKE
jgi:hypothetical protein